MVAAEVRAAMSRHIASPLQDPRPPFTGKWVKNLLTSAVDRRAPSSAPYRRGGLNGYYCICRSFPSHSSFRKSWFSGQDGTSTGHCHWSTTNRGEMLVEPAAIRMPRLVGSPPLLPPLPRGHPPLASITGSRRVWATAHHIWLLEDGTEKRDIPLAVALYVAKGGFGGRGFKRLPESLSVSRSLRLSVGVRVQLPPICPSAKLLTSPLLALPSTPTPGGS